MAAFELYQKQKICVENKRISCRLQCSLDALPVLYIQSESELNQNIFRINLPFSTDSQKFHNSFCIDSEASLNQRKVQNLCPVNSS